MLENFRQRCHSWEGRQGPSWGATEVQISCSEIRWEWCWFKPYGTRSQVWIWTVASYFFNVFYWSIQSCVNFCGMAKWFCYTNIYILFFIFFFIMVYRRILNMVPCAVQQNFVEQLFQPIRSDLFIPILFSRLFFFFWFIHSKSVYGLLAGTTIFQ